MYNTGAFPTYTTKTDNAHNFTVISSIALVVQLSFFTVEPLFIFYKNLEQTCRSWVSTDNVQTEFQAKRSFDLLN